MFRSFHIWLWGLVMELEYKLYPWKTNSPPEWAINRYNLDHEIIDEYEDHIHYNWIKSHEQKINRLQSEMIYVLSKIKKIDQNK